MEYAKDKCKYKWYKYNTSELKRLLRIGDE